MKYIKVKDLFKITKGKKVNPLEEKTDNSIRYIQIEDLRNDDNIKFCEQNDKYIIANENDIIIAWDGANAGTIGFGLNGAIGSTLAILRTNNSNINIEFCALFLKSKFRYLRDTCTGATIPHIRRDVLENIEIPSFSMDKQKKIVEILNIASELTNKRKSQIEELDLLVKSRFIEMFGHPIKNPKKWEVTTIGNIATDIRYGTSKSSIDGGKYPYIRMNNITYNGNLDLTDLKYIDIEDDELEKYIVRKGDILFNRTNSLELIGKTCVFDVDEPMIIAGYIIRIRLTDKILPIYLSMFLNSDYSKKLLRNMAKGAVNQVNINAQELKSIKILVPPIELQNQFVDFVKKVDKLKVKMEQSLKELENNFDSLIQKAFKGEVFE